MISEKLYKRIEKDGKKNGYCIESLEYPAYSKEKKLRLVVTLASIDAMCEAEKSNQLTEFDLLTCSGFDELFQLIKLRNIELDNDTIAILFKRLINDFPPIAYLAYGGLSFRGYMENLVNLIRERENE